MDTSPAIRVFGPLQLRDADVPNARQQRVVLAALAAHHPGRLSADRLVDGLWAERVPKDARTALQVLVSRLRRHLVPAGIDIIREVDGYALEVREGTVDVQLFAALCNEERSLASSSLDGRRELLERALTVATGDPFADLPDEPLLNEHRADLVTRRDEATTRLHQVMIDLDRHRDVLPDLSSWARQRPLDEGAWCRLAVALHRSGRPTEALRALHTHRQTVREQAGVEPTGAVARLEAELLADEDQSGWGRSGRGNLPSPQQSFLGRNRETRELADLLAPGRVLDLIGPGGVGKTTLALHVASGAAGRFRDGVWLCELADIENETTLVEAVASTLGIRRQRDKTMLDSLIDGFRKAEALIVVDNCEHLRQPIAQLVDTLAAECPDLTLLATSREPLDLRRELCYPVNPLPVTRSATGEPGGPAVDLFIERAAESGAVIEPDDKTTAAVAEICHHLDGIPLAIELAATRTRSMSVTEMSVRLDERFRILDQNHQDRPHRHRTLWDIVDWSYQLLDPPTRRLFDRLSVFLGGFTTDAAQAVADDARLDVEAAIWNLVDRSMAQRSTGVNGATRYHLLETLRQFGAQQLHQSGDQSATRALHLRHYTNLAVQADETIRGPDEARSVHQLNSEIANLRAAHQHAIATSDFDHAARLVAALHDYAMWRQFFELGSWAEATLELASQPTPHHPALLATAGWGRCIAGDHETAISFATRGLEIEPTVQQTNGWLNDILAHCVYFQGHDDEGLAHSEVEITRARAADDPYRLSYVLADSAVHAGLAGRVDIAKPRAREALELARRIENPTSISMAQMVMGFVTQDNSPAEAISWLREGANLADTVQSHWTAAVCRGQLALLLSLHGDPNEAIQLLLDQFHTFRRAGDSGRVRNVILQALPALHQLLDHDVQLDLVTLYHGIRNRPHIRIPMADDAIAHIIDKIQGDYGEDEVTAATARGNALPDPAVFDLASRLIKSAQDTATP